MVHYSLPAFVQGDVDSFLPGVARAKQMIKRVRICVCCLVPFSLTSI